MMLKKTFKIIGMHCTSCAITIDGELEDTAGVKQASTNYAKGTTVVEFDESKVSDDTIIAAIQRAGYEARPS